MYEEVRNHLNFKYYGQSDTPYLRATYKKQGYEHSIIIALPDEVIKTINQRIHESLLAMEAYAIENPEDDKPAEVIDFIGRPVKKTIIEQSGTSIVTAKTPKQLEKEADDEFNNMGSN